MGWLSDNVSNIAGGLGVGALAGGLFGMGGNMPTAPDYTSAANATAAGNLKNATLATQANRVNQNGINGNVQWQNTGTAENPQWTQTTSLNPGMQNLYNQGLNSHIDLNSLPAAPVNAGMTAQNAIMSRLAPQQERDTAALNTQLANQGIGLGSEAYNTAHTIQGQQQNDAQQQAALQGIGVDTQARQNALNEQVTQQQMPLQAMNALNSGSQINNPAFSQQVTTPGADLTGAANAQYGSQMQGYNAKVGQQNSMMGGLFGLGSAALISDIRLKKNIKRIGTHNLGIGLYSFDYLWGEKSIGVMAQEVLKVKPLAVLHHPSGYMMVNYGAL